MNKKGANLALIVTVIIGLVVIVAVSSNLLFGVGSGLVQRIFGERGVLPLFPGEKEFVPYRADAELSEAERTALASMNALACAINAVASGDASACTTKELAVNAREHEPPSIQARIISAHAQEAPACPAMFGQSCVTCSKPAALGEGKKLTVDDIGRLVEGCAIVSNWADNDHYCGYVIGGAIGNEITKEELVNWLKTSAGEEIRRRVDVDFGIDVRTAPLSGARGYHICADDDAGNEIYLYDSLDYDNDCKDVYVEWKKNTQDAKFSTQCAVESFVLPQKVQPVGLFNPISWVAGNNDPDFIAYFEAFPRGMEKFWHVDEISVVSVSLVVGFAAFDMIPVVGKAFKGLAQAMKKGAKETAEAMAEKGVREGIQAFFANIGRRGWKDTLRKQFIEDFAEGYAYGIEKDLAKKIGQQVDDAALSALKRRVPKAQMAEEIEQQVLKLLDDGNLPLDPSYLKRSIDDYAEGFGKRLEDLTGDERVQILSAATASYRKEIARDIAQQSAEVYTHRLTKGFARELARRMAVKQFFRQMFKEGAEEINEQAVKESVQKTLRKFVSLPQAEREKAVAAGIALSEEYVRKDGLLDFVKLTGKSYANPDAATQKLTREFLDAIGTDQGRTLAESVRRAGWASLVGLKRGTVGPHNPLTEPFKFFGDQVPISFGKFGLNTVSKAAKWINDHKYPIIVALAFYAAAQDASNEKFDPVGMNALGLARPYLRGDPKTLPLVPAVTPFYVAPKDQGGTVRSERLYLASPCKADLHVQTEICECTRVPFGVQHWKFREGTPKVDLTGITLNQEALGSDQVLYDHFVQYNSDNYVLAMSDAEAVQELLPKLKRDERQYAALFKKYPQLREWNPSYDALKTKKDAIAARERLTAVRFFHDIVNGIALSSINNEGMFVGIRAEEPADILPQRFWDYNAFFYDFAGAQKICETRGTMDAWIGGLKMSFDAVSGQDTPLASNIYAQPVYKTDCITVGMTRDPAYQQSAGANYCIDEYPYLQPVRWTLFAVEVTASIMLTAITGGTAAPAIATIAATGMLSGLAEEWIARQAKWPAYNDEGATGKVPIAQTKVSEAEWSVLGGQSGG